MVPSNAIAADVESDSWLLSYLQPLGNLPFKSLRSCGAYPRTVSDPATGTTTTLDAVYLDRPKEWPLAASLYNFCFDSYIALQLGLHRASERDRAAVRSMLLSRFTGGDLFGLIAARTVGPSGDTSVSLIGHCILIDVRLPAPRTVLGQTCEYGIWLKEAVIHPAHQHSGIGADVLREAIGLKGPTFFCSRTQHPGVLSLFSGLRWETLNGCPLAAPAPSVILPLAYLNPSSGKPDLPADLRDFCHHVLQSAMGVSSKDSAAYDPETMVLKKVFPPALVASPVPTNHPLWRLISAWMSPAAGDALFSVALPALKAAATVGGQQTHLMAHL